MVKLGSKVKDSITGFTGVATARAVYLYGCVQVLVQPGKLENGKIVESHWFDEQRLDTVSAAKSGGPQPVPPPREHPA